MFTLFAFLLFALWSTMSIMMIYEYDRTPNNKKLFNNGYIDTNYAILFSNYTLARSIRKYLRESNIERLYFEKGSYEYLFFRKEDNPNLTEIKIKMFRDQISNIMFDEPTKIIADIWKDYGSSRRYRRVFGRVLRKKYYDGDIYYHSYKETIKIFYKYWAI